MELTPIQLNRIKRIAAEEYITRFGGGPEQDEFVHDAIDEAKYHEAEDMKPDALRAWIRLALSLRRTAE